MSPYISYFVVHANAWVLVPISKNGFQETQHSLQQFADQLFKIDVTHRNIEIFK